jgi:hypothetical protein
MDGRPAAHELFVQRVDIVDTEVDRGPCHSVTGVRGQVQLESIAGEPEIAGVAMRRAARHFEIELTAEGVTIETLRPIGVVMCRIAISCFNIRVTFKGLFRIAYEMLSDLRFAARMLLKQPGFTLIAVLTLALGIGATAAVFSLIQGVLLTPPPYRDPARLVLIPEARSDGQPVTEARGWTPAQWMEWKKKAASFESLAAFEWSFNFLVLSDGSESLEGMYVTPDYFRVVGLQPMLGRTFVHSEAEQRSAPVVILGYDVWQRKFGGDPKVIGRKIRISRQDTPPVVIGVMPPGVRFLPSPTTAREPNYDVNAQVDFWAPATPDPAHLKEGGWNLVGRLRPGATPGQAQAELGVLAAQEARADHDFEGIVPRVEPLGDELNRDGRRILMPLLWAAALVLLIACGNVAALLRCAARWGSAASRCCGRSPPRIFCWPSLAAPSAWCWRSRPSAFSN